MISVELCPRKRHYRYNAGEMPNNEKKIMAFLDLQMQLTVSLKTLSSESCESYVTQGVNTRTRLYEALLNLIMD